MSKLLFFGDLHAADKAPSGRVDDYARTVIDKLDSISLLCEKNNVDHCFSTGDIFHIKQPNRVSHALTQELISTFNQFPCLVRVVAGNHDLGSDGLESLSRQPLGTLERAGAVSVLRSVMETDDFWLIPRPYNAVAEGVHDGETAPAYYSLTEEEKNLIAGVAPLPVIGLAHASILGPGDKRPYPYVNVDQIPGIEEYDLLVSGHLHECLGVMQIGKTLFANPGSIMRTQRNLSNYARTVEVLIVTVDSGDVTVEEVPLPGVAPALEVFGKREPVDSPDLPDDEINQFITMLGEGLRADELTIPELLADMGDIPPDVKAEVQRLLEAAS
jgi:DNA repair exonuclease SbcCD nuclease subunit